MNRVTKSAFALLWLFLATITVQADSDDGIVRVDSDIDESSCICGLNREMMQNLEQVMRLSKQEGSCPSTKSPVITPGLEDDRSEIREPEISPLAPTHNELVFKDPSVSVPSGIEGDESPNSESGTTGHNHKEPKKPNLSQQEDNDIAQQLLAQIQSLQNQISDLTGQIKPPTTPEPEPATLHPPEPETNTESESVLEKDSSNQNGNTESDSEKAAKDLLQQIQQLHEQQIKEQQKWQQQQLQQMIQQQLQQQQPKPINSQQVIGTNRPEDDLEPKEVEKEPTASSKPQAVKPVNSFLQGIPTSSSGSDNDALIKLNQSSKVEPEDMASALESTVPNVVSNIFTNIHDLAVETSEQNQQNSQRPKSPILTSIDGNTVNVAGSSSEQITAEGEKLFLDWIEHQLSSLHLTATTANYIRKNAVNLFRRIVKQYVQRISKLGGSIEDNVRKATQMALSNTQTLTSFILRNYINFAGGLLQIIGEQVSRVGKQLDSTGGTIATMSLNPFDIISNVIDSLPNPSDYSKYFREFGKLLMGETSASNQNSDQNKSEPSTNKNGILSKTMGALGKTFGQWMG